MSDPKKAALEAHCRQLAFELADKGVSVNALMAGVTDTPALRKIPAHEQMLERSTARHPQGRLTRPEDVATALVELGFETRDGKRRWVIFNGEAEASRVGPDWHGWLHHTFAEPPTKAPLARKAWEKPHQENLTGTAAAYAPAGSIRRGEPAARSDYEAWTPE